MNVRRSIVTACVGLFMVATACGGARDSGMPSTPSLPTPTDEVTFPLTITDAAGREVTFDEPVTKVGCRYSGCNEAMADLGIVPNASFTSGDGAFFFPVGEPTHVIKDLDNLESWAASDSDVLIELVSATAVEDAKALEMAGKVVYFNAPYKVWDPDHYREGVGAYEADLTMLAQMMGKPELAEAAIARFDALVTALQAAAPANAADTEIAILLFTDDGTYSMVDPTSPFCETIADNGLGRCADIAGWNANSWEINAEAFLAYDPQWIAYTVYSPDQTYADRDDPAWGRLTAVNNGQVFDFSGRAYCCSLRGVFHALQDYGFHMWGKAGGIPDPGPYEDFDPAKSPLIAP